MPSVNETISENPFWIKMSCMMPFFVTPLEIITVCSNTDRRATTPNNPPNYSSGFLCGGLFPCHSLQNNQVCNNGHRTIVTTISAFHRMCAGNLRTERHVQTFSHSFGLNPNSRKFFLFDIPPEAGIQISFNQPLYM